MIRKVEEAIGVFDGVTAPYDGIDVEVSWIDGKSVVAFGGWYHAPAFAHRR